MKIAATRSIHSDAKTPTCNLKSISTDTRFTKGLYTPAAAARFVGMRPATFRAWSHGYRRSFTNRPTVEMGPVITALPDRAGRSIPFIGLVEATVVQAFRRTQLPLQRIRRAIDVLWEQGELEHALASKKLYSDGAQVLFDYALGHDDGQLRLLTVVATQQRVFHEVISEYLERITFGDQWATELVLPVTGRALLKVVPDVAAGDPVFVNGGAPLTAIRSRARAGEPVASIARDYDVPTEDISEALDAIWSETAAA